MNLNKKIKAVGRESSCKCQRCLNSSHTVTPSQGRDAGTMPTHVHTYRAEMLQFIIMEHPWLKDICQVAIENTASKGSYEYSVPNPLNICT